MENIINRTRREWEEEGEQIWKRGRAKVMEVGRRRFSKLKKPRCLSPENPFFDLIWVTTCLPAKQMFLCEVFSLIMSGHSGPLASPHTKHRRGSRSPALVYKMIWDNSVSGTLVHNYTITSVHYFTCMTLALHHKPFLQALNPFVDRKVLCSDNNNWFPRVVLRS